MNDILDAVNAVTRSVRTKTIPAGDGRAIILSRTYDAEVKDVWDALTSAERLARWFLPVEGDLRLGGSYQLPENARGEVLDCEPPHRFRITWVYGEEATEKDISEVEVRLEPVGDATKLVLEHSAVIPDEMWNQFGPGAAGVGWDNSLIALAWHLRGVDFDPKTWEATPEAREGSTRAAEAWGEASIAAGEPADKVAQQVAGTTAFYTAS